jgi:hypothetical protein
MKFKSLLISQGSGSIGGLTFSHNKGGAYIRARTIPTNPMSAYQQAVRALMIQLVGAWSDTLTQDQRDAWAVYADNVLLPDKLGEPRKISGLNHYVRSNVPRLLTAEAALARVDDAPVTFNLGEYETPTIDAITAADDDFDLAFNAADAWATAVGGGLIVYASRPQSPTIKYFGGPYRFAGVVLGAVVPPASPAAISCPFPVAVGNQLFIRGQATFADGRLSAPFRLAGLAT